jgi:uncharacterized membrane protein YheB (UPF0754 family)
MDRDPSFEVFLTKDEIIEKIRQDGFNESIREHIIKWRTHMETLVETDRDRVSLEIDMLEYYAVAGFAEEEYENAIQTYYMARQTEGCEDLVDRILRIYPQLDSLVTEEQVIETSDRFYRPADEE